MFFGIIFVLALTFGGPTNSYENSGSECCGGYSEYEDYGSTWYDSYEDYYSAR